MTTTAAGNRTQVSVGDTQVEMFSGGSGPPLLFLHGAGGNSGWQAYHEELSKTHTVYVPSQPGFNGTERPEWLYTITDLAHFNQEMVQALNLDQYILMGSSMGGWVAAEMADGTIPIFMDPDRFEVLEEPLNEGFAKAGGGKGLADFALCPFVAIEVGDDLDACTHTHARVMVYSDSKKGQVS